MESYEYDIYEYFGELEYGSDSYWDANMRHLDGGSHAEQAGSKRKRDSSGKEVAGSSKKRKVKNAHPTEPGDSQLENVVYMPFEARLPPSPPNTGKQKFALLPDWKQRFANLEEDNPTKKAMPPDMRRAAEGHDEDIRTPLKTGSAAAGQPIGMRDADDDWEDEDEHAGVAGLDPEMLQTILKQKLQESGLGNMDESMFSQAIASMLSGSGDDAAGELANMLLGKANEGGDPALTGWLTQQGVRMEEEGGEDESVANEQLPDEEDTSPPDSAVGISTQRQTGRSIGKGARLTGEADESTQTNDAATASSTHGEPASAKASASIQSHKRKAQTASGAESEEKQPAKRRQPSHAAPLPAEKQSGPSAPAGRRTRAARGRK